MQWEAARHPGLFPRSSTLRRCGLFHKGTGGFRIIHKGYSSWFLALFDGIEPTAEKKTVSDRLIPSPSPRPLPKGEGEPLGSSGRAECAKAFGRVDDGRAAVAPTFGAWDRSRHSPSLDEAFGCSPLPGGEGGALFDSPSRLPSFKSLLFHRK